MKAVISHGSIPEKVQNGVSFPFSEAFIRSFDPQNSEKLSKYPIIIIDAAKKYECAFLHPCNGINFTAQVRSLSLGHVAHQAKNDHAHNGLEDYRHKIIHFPPHFNYVSSNEDKEPPIKDTWNKLYSVCNKKKGAIMLCSYAE